MDEFIVSKEYKRSNDKGNTADRTENRHEEDVFSGERTT
jgi:hypothetical protein